MSKFTLFRQEMILLVEKRNPIPIGEAVSQIMNYRLKGSTEYISINESYGRFLSEDLIATSNVPTSTGHHMMDLPFVQSIL